MKRYLKATLKYGGMPTSRSLIDKEMTCLLINNRSINCFHSFTTHLLQLEAIRDKFTLPRLNPSQKKSLSTLRPLLLPF